jgi:hypothetical protein
VAVLVCLERVPYHLRHLHASVEWMPNFATCSWALYAAAAAAATAAKAAAAAAAAQEPHLLRRQPRQPRAELLGSCLLLLGTESADQPATLLKPGILSLLRLLLLLLLLLRLVDIGVAW